MLLIPRQALRPFKDANEQYGSTMLAMGGVPQARPAAQLKQRFGAQAALIDNAIAATGRPLEALRYLRCWGEKRAGPC